MEIIDISEENVDTFLPFLGEDLSEDMKRVYFNGIGALDEGGRAAGAFVYELLNAESEEDTRGRICLLKAENKEIADGLKDCYSQTSVKENEIVESFFVLESEDDAKSLAESGFSIEKKEADTIVVTLEELGKTILGKKKKIPACVANIEDLSVLQFRDAVKQILFKGHKGLLEDIPFLPKSWFDNKVSACVRSGEKIPGLFLLRRTPSGTLIPVLLFAYGPEFQKNLMYMIRYSVQAAEQHYPPETTIQIDRKNAVTKGLTDQLLPGKTGEEIFFGTRRE